MEFKARDFHGSNALWNYVMANASLRSYINHRDQSGLSRSFLRGTGIITMQYIHDCVKVNKAINVFKALQKAINKFKAIIELKAWDFHGSNALWNYIMANASLRSYINHRDQSGLSRSFLRGTGIITMQYIHKCIKVNKAINELKTKIFQEGPIPMGLCGG
jgi:predicted GIY-YIG superfamily endonuclease